ncbi:MAG: transketolase [Candidatus Omnitrophota bacterium]
MTVKKTILRKKANIIRDRIIEVCRRNGAGHIAPSLSCVDILVALHYAVMDYADDDPSWDGRDRLVFSKAHGCYGLYAILADKGVIPSAEWEGFYTPRSTLLGCNERRPAYGLEAGCGSLGHGLAMAVGVAYGAKIQKKKYHVFCVVGDGEFQEGSNWEALQFAVKHGVNNLTVIVDHNDLQAMDFTIQVLDRSSDDLHARLKGFGLAPVVCPGHDTGKLAEVLSRCKTSRREGPGAVIARTVKGYGLKCMENIPKFHFRLPTEEEMDKGRSYA